MNGKRMGKWLCLVLLTACLLSLAACSDQQEREEPNDTEDVLRFDLSQCSIIRPAGGSTAVITASKELKTQLHQYGVDIPLNVDSTEEADGGYEILLGKTNRAESQAALQELSDDRQYLIRFTDTKIVIAACRDEALEEAVRVLSEQYIAKAESGVLSVPKNTVDKGVDLTMLSLMDQSHLIYDIMVPEGASDALYAQAGRVQERLKEVTGREASIVTDAASLTEHLILLGEPNREATRSALSGLQPNEYTVQIVDDHLVVAARSDEAVAKAVDWLLAEPLQSPTVVAEEGIVQKVLLSVHQPMIAPYCAELTVLPSFAGGAYQATYPCGNGVTQEYFKNVERKAMDSYLQVLEYYGYFVAERSDLGGNRTFTCLGTNGLVHLTYLAYDRSLTVIKDPLTDRVYLGREAAYTKVTEQALAVMTRDYAGSQEHIDDGNGESYIITLEDGRFVVIDGGYVVGGDANALYNYMKKNNRRKDGIVIAAWFFTHSHNDHYGAFQTFAATYAKSVTVESFVYNTGDSTRYTKGAHDAFLECRFVPEYRDEYFPDAAIIKPHTGQTLTFANTDFEILYTQENYAPSLIPYENDASMVFRIHLNGKTFLIMGDCEATASDLICNMYPAAALHSDVMQLNHHGYSGATTRLYDAVSPTYVLWTTSQVAFDKRVSGVKYQWIFSDAAVTVNRYIYQKAGADFCVVADGPIEIFTVTDGTFRITTQTVAFEKRT